MEEYRRNGQEGKTVFVGVDLHRFKWHVTVRTEDQELFSGTLPGQREVLRRLLDRYRGYSVQVVYEAGYFGFWLVPSPLHILGKRSPRIDPLIWMLTG